MGGHRRPNHESLPPPIQEFVGDDSDECATHERPALARTHQLVARDCEHEFQKVAIEIGVALFIRRGPTTTPSTPVAFASY